MSSSTDDSSDDDYKPEAELSDVPSEAETDYDSDGNKIDKKNPSKNTKTKRRKQQIGNKQKRTTLENDQQRLEKTDKKEIEEDDEEEKKKAELLWASFLGDSNKTNDSETEVKETNSVNENNVKTDKEVEKSEEKIVTKVFDFAGEEIKIQEKEPGGQQSDLSKRKINSRPQSGFSRSGGGLSSALSQLGKKGKMSVLEKTKHDWINYKKDEGIEEELQTFNKGKDGYLERQDFLQRTDLRQFERERDLRQLTKRSK
uniref:Craniofacial development protein 1 n=1 Tax=Culicoides sonorensis TaxID=179676 RepID=A0A336MLT7_CULSO